MSSRWVGQRDALRAAIGQAHRHTMPLVMGIVNVTPDSFSDGGRHQGDAGVGHAVRLAEEGAAILDVGGESTRPGAEPVSLVEERQRIEPVIAAICSCVETPVSIDTYKAGTARAAVACGAVMVNDVTGLRGDQAMVDVVADSGALVCIMHSRREIDGALDILDDMRRDFDTALALATRGGIPLENVSLDPGIGFGKTQAQNLVCIAQLDQLREAYGLPVLLGLSRKSFLGRALGRDVGDRLAGTLSANLAGARKGAAILRVHDVAAHRDALAIQALVDRP